jgi:hypothetical protein
MTKSGVSPVGQPLASTLPCLCSSDDQMCSLVWGVMGASSLQLTCGGREGVLRIHISD